MSALELKDVKLTMGTFHLEADFRTHAGITGMFGPSGAGKTTLLEIIAGLRQPHRGIVKIASQIMLDATHATNVPPEMRGVGYVPQDLALFPHYTVGANLTYARRICMTDDTLAKVLARLEIERFLKRFPHELSGGEKQRVALGRALLSGPKLLLLDEPLANVNARLKLELLELIRHLAEEFKVPVLYVSHDANELGTICDQIILMENGRITGQGAFQNLFIAGGTPHYRLR